MAGFSGSARNTVPSLFAAVVAADPSLPLLTHYDDASGERTELSGATLGNWVSKAANLLVSVAAEHATVWLPPHWQTAAVLLGAWSAGVTVGYGEPTASAADVEFASLEAVEAGAPVSDAERLVLGLAPMGQPLRDVPAGWTDFITEVRQHGDVFSGPPVAPSSVALIDPDGTPVTQEALVERARGRAAQLGIPAGTRVLIDADAFPHPTDWLLAPLTVGSPVVLCTHSDVKLFPARAETERATPVGP